ncbi:MAG: hypothetical protein Q4D62_07190 [Planctomycetia bacterium]|nr:hypothetical protein [Planctomycetia bacterium]
MYEIAWKGVRKEVEEGRFWVPDEEREKTLHPIETEVRRAFWEEIQKAKRYKKDYGENHE